MSTNIFGNAPNQVPTNADLGGMAYQDPRFVVIAGGNVNPTNFSTSNAQILAGNLTGIHHLAVTAGNITTLVADNFSAGNINMTGTTTTSGTVQVTNTTDSVGPSSGAVTVSGGVGVTGNLHVGGNLFVTGNTFSLSTEDLKVQDSIIELHTFANLAPLTTNDGRDIGLKMHYYDVADSHAFVGRANDTGFLEWYAKGTEGAGNVFVGSNYGTVKAGEFLSVNATSSTSTTTGAVRVTGGVGIGDGLYVNGATWLQNASLANTVITGGTATTLQVDNFSSANIYQSAAGTLVATNFSSGNIYQSAAGTLVATNFSSGNIYQSAAGTLVATNFSSGNIYQSHAGTFVSDNFSSANLLFAVGTVLHGAGIGSGGAVAGIGAAGGTGNLWIQSANLSLKAGTTDLAPIRFASGTNLTSIEAGALEYDGFSLYVTPSAGFGRAPAVGEIFTSGIGTSGIAATTNYALFAAAGDTITLPIGTYYYTIAFQATVATSTVSATMNLALRGAGTAVGSATFNGTSSITAGGAANQFQVAGTALTGAMVVTAASAVAGRVYVVRGSGILKVTSAGTLIPAYQWSATLTSGAVTLVADNFMTITPLSSSGSATKTGGFA
jgi:hypothetical protein